MSNLEYYNSINVGDDGQQHIPRDFTLTFGLLLAFYSLK